MRRTLPQMDDSAPNHCVSDVVSIGQRDNSASIYYGAENQWSDRREYGVDLSKIMFPGQNFSFKTTQLKP